MSKVHGSFFFSIDSSILQTRDVFLVIIFINNRILWHANAIIYKSYAFETVLIEIYNGFSLDGLAKWFSVSVIELNKYTLYSYSYRTFVILRRENRLFYCCIVITIFCCLINKIDVRMSVYWWVNDDVNQWWQFDKKTKIRRMRRITQCNRVRAWWRS